MPNNVYDARKVALELRSVRKAYGEVSVIDDLNLEIREGEFVTFLGPSGCGKTTTLNMIAGFTEVTAGTIILHGDQIQGLPPYRRNLGVVFQDYALFPKMTVAQNIGFGLRMRGFSTDQVRKQVADGLAMVRLDNLADRIPSQLSGGQRQRVALARALVIKPRMLLLDEPLSNLDLKLREEMRSEISLVQKSLGITTIFVTHDQDEALAMSDRVAVMNRGRVEQFGTPREVYQTPSTSFVASFVGSINLVPGTLKDQGLHGTIARVDTPLGLVETRPTVLAVGSKVLVPIRPEAIRLAPHDSGRHRPSDFTGKVVGKVYLGSRSEIHVDVNGYWLSASTIADDVAASLNSGDPAFVSIDTQQLNVLTA